MKKLTQLTALSVIMGIALTASAIFIYPHFNNAAAGGGYVEGTNLDGVNVTGQGTVTVEPDTATIQVGIVSEGSTAKEAQQKNNTDSQSVINTLKDLGIEEKNIKTAWYNINPQYDYSSSDRSQRLIGYQANHSLSVKITNLDLVSQVLDKVTEAGANNINNVQYTVENKQNALEQARKLAAQDAQNKAQKLGDVFNFRVGNLVGVQEYSESTISPQPYQRLENGIGGAVSDSAASSIQPGDVEITLTLNARFEIQ